MAAVTFNFDPKYEILDKLLLINNEISKTGIPTHLYMQQDVFNTIANLENQTRPNKTNPKQTNLIDIDLAYNKTLQAIQEFLFGYKVLCLSKTEAQKIVSDLSTNVLAIKKTLENPIAKQFIYNSLPGIFIENPNLSRWDYVFKKPLDDLEYIIQYLTNNLNNLPNHRPIADKTSKGNINRNFTQALMVAYQHATGLRPTPGSSSTNNTSAFTIFVQHILDIINKYYPNLGNITFGINDVVKQLLKQQKNAGKK